MPQEFGLPNQGKNTTSEAILLAALALGEKGLAVFPVWGMVGGSCQCQRADCRHPGKHPTPNRGVLEASKEASTIRRLWQHRPGTNIGVATGAGFFVLDEDGDKGRNSLRLLGHELPPTLTASTGRLDGGTHHYYQLPPGYAIKSSAGTLGEGGLDVRSAGTYVIVPPSTHHSGKEYSWNTDGGFAWEAMAPGPPWLLKPIDASPQRAPDPQPGTKQKSGGRNVWLTSVAGTLWNRSSNPETLRQALNVFNERECEPPLSEDEVASIAGSISKKPTNPVYSFPHTNGQADLAGTIPVLNRKELKNIPKPDWLIQDLLVAKTLTVMFGDSGCYKSFLALALAASISTGKPFAGREVIATGSTLYLAAEGIEYLDERLTAWEHAHSLEVDGVFVSKDAADTVLLRPGLVEALITTALGLPECRLVVIDTYSKSALGVNENFATEVTAWFVAAQQIRDLTGAAVLILHHTNRTGDYRGSGALMASCDAMIEVKSDAPRMVSLASHKNRGYQPFGTLYLEGNVVPAPTETNPENTSLVFVEGNSEDFKRNRATGKSGPTKESNALLLLRTFGGEAGLKHKDWRERFMAKTSLSISSFDTARDVLVARGKVKLVDGFYIAVSQPEGEV